MADAAVLLQSAGHAIVLALEAAAAIIVLVSAGRAFLDFSSPEGKPASVRKA